MKRNLFCQRSIKLYHDTLPNFCDVNEVVSEKYNWNVWFVVTTRPARAEDAVCYEYILLWLKTPNTLRKMPNNMHQFMVVFIVYTVFSRLEKWRFCLTQVPFYTRFTSYTKYLFVYLFIYLYKL
jgi:hypothetical protein